MSNTNLAMLAEDWANQIHIVLDCKELSLKFMFELIKDTYKAFTLYHKDELIPKEISKILLKMEEFAHFTALMEDNEMGKGYYHWEEFQYIVTALKEGFLKSKFEAEFPQFIVLDCLDSQYLIDFENDSLEQYILAVQSERGREPD